MPVTLFCRPGGTAGAFPGEDGNGSYSLSFAAAFPAASLPRAPRTRPDVRMPFPDTRLQPQLGDFYRAHHGWLTAWLRRKLGCAHSAADVAQDTFVRVLASRETLRMLGSIEKPRAFLSTTAGRLLIDRARRQRIEQAYLAELALAMEGCAHPSPKETLMAMQALAQIAAALDGLPPKPREAFLLHYLDGLTHAAVAQSLGVSDRMVRKYLALALLHCRAEFDQ